MQTAVFPAGDTSNLIFQDEYLRFSIFKLLGQAHDAQTSILKSVKFFVDALIGMFELLLECETI